MATECPHCYVRVFPNDDGTCPSCLKNVLDQSGVDPTKTTLIIGPSSEMPYVCCQCGLPTRRFVKVKSYGATKVQEAHSEGLETAVAILTWLTLPFALVFSKGGGGQTRHELLDLVISVPQCRQCRRSRISPVSTDHARCTMKLVVHKTFKERFEEVNVG